MSIKASFGERAWGGLYGLVDSLVHDHTYNCVDWRIWSDLSARVTGRVREIAFEEINR